MLSILLAAVLANDAQVPAGDQIGAVLQNFEPAGSSCRKDDTPSAQAAAEATMDEADLSCAVSAANVSKRMAASSILIVDTRTSGEYANGHIDSAINLSWSEVRVRSYLKNRSIVLVGSGKDDETLYSGCAALKRAGIPGVTVLRGGMLAWADAELPIVGRSDPFEDARVLDDEEFMQALAFPANVILGMADAEDFSSVTPRVLKLKGSGANAIGQILEQRARQIGDVPFASVILVVNPASRSTGVEDMIRAARPHPVLIYRGTPAHYAAFVKTKRAVWLAQARGPRSLPCSTR